MNSKVRQAVRLYLNTFKHWQSSRCYLLMASVKQIQRRTHTHTLVSLCVCTLQTQSHCPQGRCMDVVFWRRGRLCCTEWSPGFRHTATHETRSLKNKHDMDEFIFPCGFCCVSMTVLHLIKTCDSFSLVLKLTDDIYIRKTCFDCAAIADFVRFLLRHCLHLRKCCLNKESYNKATSEVSIQRSHSQLCLRRSMNHSVYTKFSKCVQTKATGDTDVIISLQCLQIRPIV